MKKIKALVTGGNGFIGSHLLTLLKEKDYEVYPLSHKNLRDKMGLSILETFQDIDYIFHLAAYGNMHNQQDEVEIFNANITGVWNLLQSTKLIPYKAFINVSSSSVHLPTQTFYSGAKKSAEALCKSFADTYHKPIVSLRPYSVYGPGEATFRFIPTVIHNLLRGQDIQLSPKPQHDWIYVRDVVKEMVSIAENIQDYQTTSVRECGTGFSASNQDIVDLLVQISGKEANIKRVASLRSFDTDKWVAPYSVAEPTPLITGLKKTYAWYKEKYEA